MSIQLTLFIIFTLTVIGLYSNPQKIDAQNASTSDFDIGNKYYETNNYEEAIKHYDKDIHLFLSSDITLMTNTKI